MSNFLCKSSLEGVIPTIAAIIEEEKFSVSHSISHLGYVGFRFHNLHVWCQVVFILDVPIPLTKVLFRPFQQDEVVGVFFHFFHLGAHRFVPLDMVLPARCFIGIILNTKYPSSLKNKILKFFCCFW